ncbi:MAG: hypothetical protein JXQ66_06755 [Campylobacterales bacterium]|nr:hypothetical protein [Campylobacterales bacterium]
MFNPLPGNHYLEVTTKVDEITDSLDNLLKKVDGELNLALYSEDDLDIKTLYPNLKAQHIKSFKQPYRAIPRHYDVVVFKDFFHLHQNRDMVLKIAYTTLANTADIVIMEKKGVMDVEEIKQMLDKFEFRAVNHIDVLPEYDLVMGKKMHMWGNGL